jgi:hypothetical protein
MIIFLLKRSIALLIDSFGLLTIRWSRPGMQRDLHAMMINREKRRARVGANPGCSAQSRWAAPNTEM